MPIREGAQRADSRGREDRALESSLTISAKPDAVGAVSQESIPMGEQSSLLTHIAATGSGSLCVRMKS
ncbi:MAG: hypothetical protein DMG96_29145 [Acidobacteria bacterium]|nr:MAG: hypothetical protein DMG96_29145 [Acidobacteriota bacterium]